MKTHERWTILSCRRTIAALSTVVITALAVTACSKSSPKPDGTSNGSSSAALSHLLPDDIRKTGVITVASLDDLPPWSFTKSGKYVGIDVDITDALAKLLGVRFEYQTIAFTGQLPGLSAGRFDLIIDEIGDTVEREKVASFVDYSTDSNGIVVQKGNPKNIESLDDLCGKTVVVIDASLPQKQAQTQAAKCSADGKAKLTISAVPSVTAMYLAVSSGRADATLNGYSTAAYSISQGGITKDLQMAPGAGFQSGLNGIAFAKGSALGPAIQAALNSIMKSGEYAAIMKKWNVSALGLTSATIDSAAQYSAAHPS